MGARLAGRVLITGSAGFIGSRLVKSYIASGARVTAVTHRKPEPAQVRSDLADEAERVELDLQTATGLEGAFAGHELVIHAAVMRPQARSARQLQERVNLEMTTNVVEACIRAGVRRLVHVSSTAAIGISGDPRSPADERFRFNLEGSGLNYNVSKHRSEELVLQANGRGLETVVANPGFVFGDNRGRYRGAEVITRILDARLVVCTGGGLSMVHVDDVVDGILQVGEAGRPAERYILSGDNRSFRDIAETVCRVAGVRRVLLSVPDVARDALGLLTKALKPKAVPKVFLSRHYAYQHYSSDKARRELDYRPRSFEEIVADYLARRRARSAAVRA